jgi:hypothetical protein
VLALSACASAHGTNAAPATTTTLAAVSTATNEPTITSTTTALPAPPVRVVVEQAWVAFGIAVDVTLHYPSSRVERIGFHQSNNEGARAIEPLDTGIPATTMETRDRLSDLRSSADVVVDPESEIRSPVSGTVVSSGSYILYCGLRDYFINIEPDDHPGWRVKVLHMTGLNVGNGDRVVQGEAVIAPGARQLPFDSQVDELRTVAPAWPHVHIEVIDPSIPDVPNPGSGYENC